LQPFVSVCKIFFHVSVTFVLIPPKYLSSSTPSIFSYIWKFQIRFVIKISLLWIFRNIKS
jgi:hypothetical protein